MCFQTVVVIPAPFIILRRKGVFLEYYIRRFSSKRQKSSASLPVVAQAAAGEPNGLSPSLQMTRHIHSSASPVFCSLSSSGAGVRQTPREIRQPGRRAQTSANVCSSDVPKYLFARIRLSILFPSPNLKYLATLRVSGSFDLNQYANAHFLR